jgi:RNA polymerase sigma-70 factor (ECF subfamily)
LGRQPPQAAGRLRKVPVGGKAHDALGGAGGAVARRPGGGRRAAGFRRAGAPKRLEHPRPAAADGRRGTLADDLAQDAFLVAFQRIADFRAEGSFAGWVKRIAARLYLRRLKGNIRLEAPLEAAEETGGPGEGWKAMKLDLEQALEALSPAERLCVSLCHGAGLTHAEIAEQLKAPLGTVKSHVKRGLDKLRARLDPGSLDDAPPADGRLGHG